MFVYQGLQSKCICRYFVTAIEFCSRQPHIQGLISEITDFRISRNLAISWLSKFSKISVAKYRISKFLAKIPKFRAIKMFSFVFYLQSIFQFRLSQPIEIPYFHYQKTVLYLIIRPFGASYNSDISPNTSFRKNLFCSTYQESSKELTSKLL